jgi:hypothetical protein
MDFNNVYHPPVLATVDLQSNHDSDDSSSEDDDDNDEDNLTKEEHDKPQEDPSD